MDLKENHSLREPVMEGTLKHMISPTEKIKIDTIVTEKAIHIRFVPTMKRKGQQRRQVQVQ